MKLLAKTAEERYQTAGSLESDLRRCLAEWETQHRIGDFRLGEHDTPDRLLIPERLYGREREVETLRAPGPTGTIEAPVEHLDLATVIKVSQAVSDEIVQEKQLEILMRTAIEQAGAERGVLVLSRWTEPRIAAQATTGDGGIVVKLHDEAMTPAVLPESVIQYVVRTNESVILDDAAAQNPFSADPYIRQQHALSILCLPLLNQGQLIGVLYLENNLTPGVFAPARIAVLKLLASQAAISLENARLYRDLAEREAKIRRLVEAQTPQAEDELRAIIDNAPVFLWSDLPDGYCDFLNQRWLTYFNLSLQEAQGAGWATVLHPDDAAHHLESWQKSVSTGIPFETEARYRRSDGEYRWFLNRAYPLRDKTGRIVKWYGTNIDIENLKRTEERLRQSEAYLAEAQRLSHTGTWAFNATTTLYWSEESYRIWGLDPLQGLPNRETVWQRIHPDDRDRVYEGAQEALRQKRDYAVEFRIVLPNGTVKYLESISRPVFSARGELVEVVGTHVDVTERKRAEKALRESEAKFRDYAETASDWLWETGPDYKFTQLTENAFGSDPAVRIGTVCWDHALDLETEPEKWRLVRETLDSRKPFRDFVYCAAGGNGSRMYVKASGRPVFDANREFRGYRGTGTDVTAIMRAQRAEESLRTVQAELAHVSRVTTLGQLTASIAHEITQPIASARNNARAALNFLDQQPPDLGEVREALGCVVGDADRTGDIIDRIRDHIKKAPPRKHRFDLNEAINKVLVLARSAITENGVSVQTRLTEGVVSVEGDRVQLQQVVLNLILNAVEAMGSVEAGARELLISTEENQPDAVLVAVRDSGPGIGPEHLERVFEAFYTTKFQRSRDGAGDLPVHHRCPRGPAVGRCK